MHVTVGDLGQPMVTVSATLQHSISNGQSTVTGALSISSARCLTPSTVAIQAASFQDPNFAFDVPTGDGTLHFTGRVNASNTLALDFQIRGGTCDGTSAAGTLARQTSASASTPGIHFSFRVPQGGTYGGELWVSPPTFVIAGNPCAIDTRVLAVNSAGTSADISATFTPEDSSIIKVAPAAGHQVTISVSTAGTTGIKVSASGFSDTVLMVQATPQSSALVCTLTQ